MGNFLCWSHWVGLLTIPAYLNMRGLLVGTDFWVGGAPQSFFQIYRHQPYFGYSYFGEFVWICLMWFICTIGLKQTTLRGGASQDIRRFATWCIYLKILYMLFVHWNMHTVKTVEFVWSWGAYLQNRRCEYVPRNSLQPIDHIHALASKEEPSALLFGCQRHQAAPDRRKLLGGVGSAAHGMSLGFKRVIYRSLESKPTSPSQWKRALLKRASDSTICIEIYPWWLEMVKNFEGWGWLILMFADDVSAKKATGRSRLMQHVFLLRCFNENCMLSTL